jgi:hypothetical protein
MSVTASDRAPATPYVKRSRRWSQAVFQMVSLWGAFTGLLAIATPCPCCGRVGCPVGLGLFAAAGGVLAFCVRGRDFIARKVSRIAKRGRTKEK